MAVDVAAAQRPYRFPPSVASRIRTLAELPADVAREYPRPGLLQQCGHDGLRALSSAALVEQVRALQDIGQTLQAHLSPPR